MMIHFLLSPKWPAWWWCSLWSSSSVASPLSLRHLSLTTYLTLLLSCLAVIVPDIGIFGRIVSICRIASLAPWSRREFSGLLQGKKDGWRRTLPFLIPHPYLEFQPHLVDWKNSCWPLRINQLPISKINISFLLSISHIRFPIQKLIITTRLKKIKTSTTSWKNHKQSQVKLKKKI